MKKIFIRRIRRIITLLILASISFAALNIFMNRKANMISANLINKLRLDNVMPLKSSKTNWDDKEMVLYNTYFGMLHSHTNYSDGQGTPEEAYAMAKANADFFAVTEHAYLLDGEKDAALLNADGTEKNCIKISKEWKSLHDIADKYNEDGKFAAIAGYEMTWNKNTGGYGHINTFNTAGFEARTHAYENLKKYYYDISKLPYSISQFNHPGTQYGDFDDFSYRTEEIDNVVNLIEVGNGEDPIRSSLYYTSYDYYTRALDKGWHLAPVSNQDNHKGNWIKANDARTVILAPSLTRTELYKALKNMRVYSTEDKNLKINYTVNNKIMGSKLDQSSSLNFVINVNDQDETDKIKSISVIVNGGKIVKTKKFNSNKASWKFSLHPKYSYYYLKIVEADKDIAVTAPVWTGN
ncbi:MAG: CehA/McbA family metallohydrolase [Bacillota bacterium]|nr:CehA/McbA family metallohydrolase [Bacillota bacterium]